MPFADLKARYSSDDDLELADLPGGTTSIEAIAADGTVRTSLVHRERTHLDPLPRGTHTIDARDDAGRLLGSELTTVAEPGEQPVTAFVSTYDGRSLDEITRWIRDLRATSVQFYDWMASYAHPVTEGPGWLDPLGRHVDRSALTHLVRSFREQGAAAQAYAPVYAVDPPVAAQHPDWLLYRNDGQPHTLGDLLTIADPGSPRWQEHWLSTYSRATELGFDGFHLDTYGYPRRPLDVHGVPVDMAASHHSFLDAVRAQHPAAILSFNQVNGVPDSFDLPTGPGYRYVEVWPPNRLWRHFEGLLARSRTHGEPPGVLAVYPPVWDGDPGHALRTVVLSEAVATAAGIGTLIYGDARGALHHPYYPDYRQLDDRQAGIALAWHRFALQCRDLFAGGEDTTWTELDDENGTVTVTATAHATPEPTGGHLFARVNRQQRGDLIAVSVIDLTGSPGGAWDEVTAAGSVREATVDVHVAQPERWRVEVAALGVQGGRFQPATSTVGEHRQGRAISTRVPLGEGWAVLRLRRLDGRGAGNPD